MPASDGNPGGERVFYINGRFLEQPLSGVQRYAREMVGALDRLIGTAGVEGERWCLLTTGRETERPHLDHIEVRQLPSRFRGHAWEQTALARASGDGILIGLGGSGPLLRSRQLVVVHDASVFRHPEYYSTRYRLWHQLIVKALSRRSRIATVSRFSQQELAEVLRLPAGDIEVFYNGSDHMRVSRPDPDVVGVWRLQDRPYFVLLGNLTKNKNMEVAIQAAQLISECTLVIVGSLNSRVFGQGLAQPRDDRALFVGRVDDASLAGLLTNAQALIFPSLYEGFGIPPLEAMVNGCPVIASDIPAVREVCGDAAVYFNPHEPAELVTAMHAIIREEPAARERRQQRGHARAASFTWENSARELLLYCRTEFVARADRPRR